MFMSLKFCDSKYFIQNAVLTGLLRNEMGVIWAIEGFNVYARRHVCVNITELTQYNGAEDTATLISYALLKGF